MMTLKSLFKAVINKAILALVILFSSHVQAETLCDCSLLLQYNNLEYSGEQLSFEQFKVYFHKHDIAGINHTLFTPSGERTELPFESCLSLIPDTLDHNCLPGNIWWIPCRYIEHEDFFYFFVIKDCSTPKIGFLPYVDYMILVFHKDGKFKGASNIYHWDDSMVVDEAVRNNSITNALDIFTKRVHVEQIKLFYDRYMECIEEWDNNKLSDLQNKFLTPEMLEKKERLVTVTGSDPILRAQDVSEYGQQSLTCRHLEDDWYEVAYHWDVQDTTAIRIPVRVEEDEKGQVRINYIVPHWGGSRYGDNLFDIPSQDVIDGLGARTFVETFFKAYVYPYAIMSPSLEQDLEQLRNQYCTTSFLQGKYAAVRQAYQEDYEDIDPLVDCADFDAFWYPSIKVDSLSNFTYRISYDTDIVRGWRKDIKIVLKREEGRFLISDIEKIVD